MKIRDVIINLGGISAVARGLNHRHVTTVQGWWDREVIPARRQRDVLRLAEKMGIEIPADAVIPDFGLLNSMTLDVDKQAKHSSLLDLRREGAADLADRLHGGI